MFPFVALVAAIVWTSLALWLVYAVAFMAFLPTLFRQGGFALDEKRFEELLAQYRLGRFIAALHPIAWWWCNGPMFLWFRLVKKDRTVDFSHPRPKKRD
jgi:hypothetical protein